MATSEFLSATECNIRHVARSGIGLLLRLSCDLSLELLVPETKRLILARDLILGFLGVMVTNGLGVNLLGVGIMSPQITVPESKNHDCVVWCGVVRCGVVWCGVRCCGVLCCAVVWYGVVWCDVV